MDASRSARIGGLLGALVLAMASCGDDAGPGAPDPAAQGSSEVSPTSSSPSSPSPPSPSPTSPSSFESDRHSYTVELPPGWAVSEFGGTWTTFEQFSPGAEVPGEDVASSPDTQGFLVANSMAIPDGTSPADWVAQLLRLTRSGRAPGCDEAIDTEVLAGEQATIVEHRCEDTHVVGRSLTHGGRGYYFTIGFPADDLSARGTLEGIIASVRFVER